MAFTLTDRGHNEGTYDATANATSAAFTPAQNDIIVVMVSTISGGGLTSVSGWSATWVQIAAPNAIMGLSVWAARIGASPGSDNPLMTFAGGSENFTSAVLQISGANTSKTVAVGAGNLFPQVSRSEAFDQASPWGITALSTFESATNLSLTVGAISGNLPLAPKSGFTQIIEYSDAVYNPNVWAAYKAGSDTAHQLLEQTTGDFDYKYLAGVAIEVAEAAGSSTITSTGALSAGSSSISGSGNVVTGPDTHTSTGALSAGSSSMSGTGIDFQVVTGASILLDSSSLFLNLDFSPVNGDKVGMPRVYAGSNFTLNANGTFSIDPALPNDTVVPRIAYDTSAATWYADTVTISTSGALTLYASGALQAQNSSMSGVATPYTSASITSTGVLTAQNAQVSGAASYLTHLTSSGALQAQNSTIEGYGGAGDVVVVIDGVSQSFTLTILDGVSCQTIRWGNKNPRWKV